MIKTIDPIECLICKKIFNGQVNGLHLKSHDTTTAQYRVDYGPTQTETYREKCLINGSKGGSSNVAREYGRKRSLLTRESYYKNPRQCKFCSEILPYKSDSRQRFCSRSCSALFTQSLRGH